MHGSRDPNSIKIFEYILFLPVALFYSSMISGRIGEDKKNNDFGSFCCFVLASIAFHSFENVATILTKNRNYKKENDSKIIQQ